MYRAIAIAAAFLAATPPAALAAEASPPPPLTEATATWTSDGKVDLSVTYEGGACEETGQATVTVGTDTTAAVTIPTVETAEICTMQIVPVTYTGTIAVEPDTTSLSITVLDPEGQPKAAGTAEIASR